jgi:dipeptidyl aminopeptidase/acylaminoacyl peptidase
MSRRFLSIIVAAAGLTTLAGCVRVAVPAKAPVAPAAAAPQPAAGAEAGNPATAFPELGSSRLVKPGIQFQEATLQRGGVPMRVWFYQPEKATGKLALVIVPPAGSTLIAGMDLGDGDRDEHFPYARAGFAVASFEIDGHVPQGASDAAVLQGARKFKDAEAGLANARTALDFILAKVPNVDTNRVYVAGHSSAATLALLFAEHEPRVKACIAYAPVTDVEDRLAKVIPTLDKAIPGYRDFIRFSSPKTHADKLKCPVFLFCASDDTNVPPRHTTDFGAALKKTNSSVTIVTAGRGGHYESMIREGVPKGIQWLQKLP